MHNARSMSGMASSMVGEGGLAIRCCCTGSREQPCTLTAAGAGMVPAAAVAAAAAAAAAAGCMVQGHICHAQNQHKQGLTRSIMCWHCSCCRSSADQVAGRSTERGRAAMGAARRELAPCCASQASLQASLRYQGSAGHCEPTAAANGGGGESPGYTRSAACWGTDTSASPAAMGKVAAMPRPPDSCSGRTLAYLMPWLSAHCVRSSSCALSVLLVPGVLLLLALTLAWIRLILLQEGTWGEHE
jgi:hypothetical protein